MFKIFLKNLSVVKKFALGFGIILALLLGLLIYSFYIFGSINKITNEETLSLRVATLASDLDIDALHIIVLISQYNDIYDQNILNDLEKNRELAIKDAANLRKLAQNPEVIADLDAYEALLPLRIASADKIINAVDRRASFGEIKSLRQEREVFDNEARSYLRRIVEIENEELVKTIESGKGLRITLQMNIILVTLVILIIIVIVSFWIVRSITVPITSLNAMALKISEGNFDARTTIEGNDELGQLGLVLNNMAGRLKKLYTGLEQKTVELKVSQERLDLALDGAKMGAWDLDLIHDKAERTLKHDQIFGYQTLQKEWGAKIFGEHVIPEDRQYATECFEKAFKTGVFAMQCRIRWLDKSIHWIEALGHVYYEKEKPVRMLGTVLDITDRKNAEASIIEAKAKDEAMLAGIADGLVVVGKDMKIILINRAAENAIGWQTKDVLGKVWGDVIAIATEDGKSVEPNKRPLFLAIHGEATTTTYLYTRKDKTTFPVSLTVSPVKVGNELIGAILVFRDVTREREIDKAKTEFVSLASHQLRTPLSTVNWYAEMLLAGDAGKLNKEQKKYLNEIYGGNQRMVQLVNALLNVSRLELGTFLVEPEPTNIVDLANSAIEEQKPQINEKKLKLISKFEKNIPIIPVDPKLLRMVFQNLLSNSVKYTPEDGEIEFEISSYDKDNVIIKISDSGYGIPKDQQDRIFTKLFRADNVREKDTEGTGLGLYIVKSIIEHSGGRVWFESPSLKQGKAIKEGNVGTTFYVILPIEGMKRKDGLKSLA